MSHGGGSVVTEKMQLGAGDLTVLCHAAHHSTPCQKHKGMEAQVDAIKRSTRHFWTSPIPHSV